jgi:hypothetical protein
MSTELKLVGVYGLAENSFGLWKFVKTKDAEVTVMSRVLYHTHKPAQLVKRFERLRYSVLSKNLQKNVEGIVEKIADERRSPAYLEMRRFLENCNSLLGTDYDVDRRIREYVLARVHEHGRVDMAEFKKTHASGFQGKFHKFIRGQGHAGKNYQV